ncbi:unnamed protein product [Lampetra fluviatilis]
MTKTIETSFSQRPPMLLISLRARRTCCHQCKRESTGRARISFAGLVCGRGTTGLAHALDDDSLAAFNSIPEADRSSFTDVCSAMAAIIDPPSNIRRILLPRKLGDTETALAFHSTILALGQVAYRSMDQAALHSLALEQRLVLV